MEKVPIQVHPFSHIDLRVSDMEAALTFYRRLMPELGFSVHNDDQTEPTGEVWHVFAAEQNRPVIFFGITEDPDHQANKNRIAFFAENREAVNRIAGIVAEAGGRNIEGPIDCPEYFQGYFAVFFEDPAGNRLEVVTWPT